MLELCDASRHAPSSDGERLEGGTTPCQVDGQEMEKQSRQNGPRAWNGKVEKAPHAPRPCYQ